MPEAKKARAVGFNHIALEVGDIDEALAFYGRLFDLTLRGRSDTAAFIDLGDQFLALQKGPQHRRRTMAGISGSSSTTRKSFARRSRPRVSTSFPAGSLTSAIRGATASRSSATTTSSSPRRRTCYAGWAWLTWRRATGRSRS